MVCMRKFQLHQKKSHALVMACQIRSVTCYGPSKQRVDNPSFKPPLSRISELRA